MQKKKKSRLKSRKGEVLLDLFIVISCLLICFKSLKLFWQDINRFTLRSDMTPVATITFKQKIAQRKFSDRVVWERLQQHSPLYNSDTVRTADLAFASINFNDGTVVDLQANSMIQIFYTEDGVKLSVSSGGISVDASKTENNVAVQIENGPFLSMDAGSKLIAQNNTDEKSASFQLQKGNAEISTDAGIHEYINAGESIQLSQGGLIERGKITVTSITNDMHILNFKEEDANVHLQWQAEDLDEELVVQVSNKKDFSNILNNFVVTDSSVDFDVKEGLTYWRLYPVSDVYRENVLKGRVRVDKIPQINTSVPSDNAIFSFSTRFPSLQFAWDEGKFVDFYVLEISRTPEFTDLKVKEQLDVNRISLSLLTEGTYYWRVTPYYSVNNTGYGESSPVKQFKIVRRPEIPVPQLSVPANNAKLIYDGSELSTSFAWKSDLDMANYSLLISTTADFKEPIIRLETDKTRIHHRFNLEELPLDNYYWKILCELPNETKVYESETRKFTTVQYALGQARLAYPPEAFDVEAQKISDANFIWRISGSTKDVESIIQFSSDKNFKTIAYEYETDGTSFKNLKLPEGKYYWRVGIRNINVLDYEFTSPRVFNIVSELRVPSIRYPNTNAKVVIFQNKEIKLDWNNVPGADYYNVLLVDEKSGDILLDLTNQKSTSITAKLPYLPEENEHKVRLSIQAVKAASGLNGVRRSRAGEVSFTMRRYSPIKQITPQNNYVYNGLTAVRGPVVLKWQPGLDMPVKTELILRKQGTSGVWDTIATVPNSNGFAMFERLGPGVYQWYVKATDKYGNVLNTEHYFSFTIKQTPELLPPVLTEPHDRFIVDDNYLRKNRSLNFSWKAVSGATDYTFTLYQRLDNGSTKQVYSEKVLHGKTEVRIKDLSILDVGNFEWHVMAYAHAKDGFEEQKGKISTRRFKISFNMPGKIETKDPGMMYGE